MRPWGTVVGSCVLFVALSPAFAATPTLPSGGGPSKVADVALIPAPPAPALPVPYPVGVPQPPACKADWQNARDAAERARVRLNDAVKAEAKMASEDKEAAARAGLRSAQAYCCASGPLTAAITAATFGVQEQGLGAACVAMLAMYGGTIESGHFAHRAEMCRTMAIEAADSAAAAGKRPLAAAVKSALGDLVSADKAFASQLTTCLAASAPAAPTPPPPPAGPNASCDGSHPCGPGLECRSGTCRVPCACAPPCAPDPTDRGSCKKKGTRRVRKDCVQPPRNAPCPPGCFRADGVCRIDVDEPFTEACALTCP